MEKIPELEFLSGFVLHPDKFYSPSHRISPFRTSDISKNLGLPHSTNIIKTLNNRFEGRKWCYTKSGKEGISDNYFTSNIAEKCYQKGLLVVHTGRESIKIGPPLSISIEALKEGIEVIRQSIIEVIDS